MLSNKDIVHELGKNIAIFPLSQDNLKGASYNLTASRYAWTYWETDRKYYEYDGKKFYKGTSCVSDNNIILFPHCITLVETDEVLAVGNNIGGTFHSRVTMVNRGIGHISTCLGPNWCGQCLIALHNSTDATIVIHVGDEICSVIFEYLTRPSGMKNQNKSGHTDKFAKYGIKLSVEEEKDINADWKGDFNLVSDRMTGIKSQSGGMQIQQSAHVYKLLKDLHKRTVKSYFNRKNVMSVLLIVLLVGIVFAVAAIVEHFTGNTVWWEYAWTVLISGVLIYIIQFLMNNVKRR